MCVPLDVVAAELEWACEAACDDRGGGDQLELWKYSRVGTLRRAAPSRPALRMSKACGRAWRARESSIARRAGVEVGGDVGEDDKGGNVVVHRNMTSA